MLYLIEILHQTTTSLTTCPRRIGCILSKFYIKPQLAGRLPRGSLRCILSKFYIKPQRSTLYGWKSMVVSYRNSTSNHNSLEAYIRQMKLYLIEILHQTTTTRPVLEKRSVLYLIEILHQTTTSLNGWRLTLELYLIEILHQTTTLAYIFYTVSCCILSKFYIKPQQRCQTKWGKFRCILSKFYIKPQPAECFFDSHCCCILSKFYIKPQQLDTIYGNSQVVSYRNSTSNHNVGGSVGFSNLVVSYRNSTSNHNFEGRDSNSVKLYLIEILHQTTTR